MLGCSSEMLWDTLEMEQSSAPNKILYGAIDSEGNWLVPPIYDSVEPLGSGFVKATRGKKTVILNKSNEILSHAFFDNVEKFQDGAAQVTENGNKGFINAQGEYVLRPQFTQASILKNGYVLATTDGSSNSSLTISYYYANYESKLKFTYDNSYLPTDVFASDGYFPSPCEPLSWGFQNEMGIDLIPCKFANAIGFSEDLSAAQADANDTSSWGYIDKRGEWVIPPKYNDARSFENGKALVGKLETNSPYLNYYYIDSNGKKLYDWIDKIPAKYENQDQCPKVGNDSFFLYSDPNSGNRRLGRFRNGEVDTLPIYWKTIFNDDPKYFYIKCPEEADFIPIGVEKERLWFDRNIFAIPARLRKFFGL